MSQIKNILGTSLLSLFLVIWGLFMVCSGRVPEVQFEDDLTTYEGNNVVDDNSDFMAQLALLDDESTKLEDSQRSEILEALGIESSSAGLNSQEDDFLTEELFLDLEVEIAELEKLSNVKTSTIDSLKVELQEADHRLSALSRVVNEPITQFASKNTPAPQYAITNNTNSEYALSYQDALDNVYSRQFTTAIDKFHNLLRMDDTESLADNCQYWIAESYYALGNFELAIAEFERVFAFENNNKADDAQFMIGMAYKKIGEKQLAQIELNNLLIFYQNSEYVSRAEQLLLELNI